MNLLPCPFCGNEDIALYAKNSRYGAFIYARCDVCGAQSGTASSIDISNEDEALFSEKNPGVMKVITKWNSRK